MYLYFNYVLVLFFLTVTSAVGPNKSRQNTLRVGSKNPKSNCLLCYWNELFTNIGARSTANEFIYSPERITSFNNEVSSVMEHRKNSELIDQQCSGNSADGEVDEDIKKYENSEGSSQCAAIY